jgi:hypothetical protein
MPTKLVLAAIASFLLTAQVFAQAPATPQKLNAILCETEDQDMAFAASAASGKDRANRHQQGRWS